MEGEIKPPAGGSYKGERCRMCGGPAEHRIEKTIRPDDPTPRRRPLAAYFCQGHFCEVMGLSTEERPPADRSREEPVVGAHGIDPDAFPLRPGVDPDDHHEPPQFARS
jgi:hypothetical protein